MTDLAEGEVREVPVVYALSEHVNLTDCRSHMDL